jgi:nitroimidazol reductase NimA-like FMN-containing flavoprotein (pyridoxamine 5'-phosphate oxidase superfamily)
MFREMRRFKQQIPDDEVVKLLKTGKRGVLALLGDGGYPYAVPLDYWYDEQSGAIYFHCAKEGHKIDAVRGCDKASFCITGDGHQEGGDWPLHFDSVIAFGRISVVEDRDETLRAAYNIALKFHTEQSARHELDKARNTVAALKLVPEHITGKRVREK